MGASLGEVCLQACVTYERELEGVEEWLPARRLVLQEAGVEVGTVRQGGDADEHRLSHGEQGDNDLVDELQVAVGRLLENYDRSADSLEGLQTRGGAKGWTGQRGNKGAETR